MSYYLDENRTNYIKTFTAIIIATIGIFCIFYFWSPGTKISDDSTSIQEIKKIENEINNLSGKIKELDNINQEISNKIDKNTKNQSSKIKKIIGTKVENETSNDAVRNFTNSW